jgi:transcriptional regulator with XRE-family HTH domain
LREALGWTQEETAERLGVTLRHMKRIEHGHNMTLRTLQWIASVLKVTPASLVSPPREWAPRRPGRPRRQTRAN